MPSKICQFANIPAEQLHSPPGAGFAAWTPGSHPLPRYPDDELCRQSLCFDCGTSSPSSILSRALTEGSLNIPRIAMPNGEEAHSRQETPRPDGQIIDDSNLSGTFGWESNSTLPFEYSFNIDDNDLSFNDLADGSGSSVPGFQFSWDPSLAHDPVSDTRLTTSGIELPAPESIFVSDWHSQDDRSAVDSLVPLSVEHALSSDVSTLLNSSILNTGIDVDQFNFRHVGDFASEQFTYGSNIQYPPHLDFTSDLNRNTPNPDFACTLDQDETFLSAPHSGFDSPPGQRDSPHLLGPFEINSQASSSRSNLKRSKSPDLGGATQCQKTAVPIIRWPSPESSEHSQIRDPNEKRRGRRKGSLPPPKRTKVSETRRIGACMSCALAKVECDGDKDGICARCKKEQESPRLFSSFEICTRARLSDYIKLLFPRALKRHLDKAQVDQLANIYDNYFTLNTVEAQFSCGRDYPPLVLLLTEYVPPFGERPTIAVIPSLVQQGVTFEQRFPATLALPRLDDDLQQKCLDHIKSMVRHHCDNKQVVPMQYSSEISTRVFAAVCKFHRAISTSGDVSYRLYRLRLGRVS